MELHLYNTLGSSLQVFQPADPQRVTMYVCGPTVYDLVHIGNARPVVVFDVLSRMLRKLYPKVIYARNITDVDDKITAAAQAAGISIGELTRHFTAQFETDMRQLGALEPDIQPLATAHIQPMIAMVQALLKRGHAYVTHGHVLFHVPSFPEYGRLSRRKREEQIAGARVEVAPFKRDPADFVLWKPSDDQQPGWPSPWGRGRPGWHLECSAMIETHLGNTIDIHAGGRDLIFSHHENEIAQSVCAHGGEDYVRYWLHNGHVTVNGQKMSKSIGNMTTVRSLLERFSPRTLRYALLTGHYRRSLEISNQSLLQSEKSLQRLDAVMAGEDPDDLKDARPDPIVWNALLNDLNTPQAIAQLHRMANDSAQAKGAVEKASRVASLRASCELLGITDGQSTVTLSTGSSDDPNFENEVESLIEQRKALRLAARFEEADEVRNALSNLGVGIEDTAQGTRWHRLSSGYSR
ncbi:cysteine--tRNA ligase [Pseudomonas putida]|uniref:cysteine--tRNA ligase n=1 Tax=Pseudomonas putida TaxID=303 RepID=UPI0009A18F44|nr:cysteine--tRNA ligase [Pseudomonas putida]